MGKLENRWPVRRARRTTRRSEAGSVIVMVALLLTALMGVAALAVDAGHVFGARGELQNAVDAAALGGATALGQGTARVRERAREYAERHRVIGQELSLSDADVELGRWDRPSFVGSPGTELEFAL